VLKRIFELLLMELHFRVLNEICDDRRQEKCGVISTLVIALIKKSSFTVVPLRKFRPHQKPYLLRR